MEKPEKKCQIPSFLPSKNDLEELDPKIITMEGLEGKDYTKYNSKFVLFNNIPYFRYWQLENKEAYAFHPSKLGGVFYDLALEGRYCKLNDVFKSTLPFAVRLPNGGLTWYYPKIYPLSRMVGPYPQTSAYSQSSLLAGAMMMARNQPEIYSDFMHKIRLGLELDYHKGGVLWADKFFL